MSHVKPVRPLTPLSEDPHTQSREGRDDEVTEEAQERQREVARGRKDPGQPTEEERKRHNITHLPYRSWCADCVAGRGRAHAHVSRDPLEEDAIPIVGMDYHFMGTEGEEGTIPMLCVKDSHTKVVFDFVIPEKGVNEYVVTRVLGALAWLGYKRVVIKTAQEPSIVALVEAVKARFSGDVIPECSPVRESQSNGMIESGILTCSNQIRVMKLALERHLGEIGSDHPAIYTLVS